MNHLNLIEQLGAHMGRDLGSALYDQRAELLAALQKVAADGAENDTPMKFTVSLSGVLDLSKNTVVTTFAFSVKTTVKDEHAIESPNEPRLF